MNLIKISDIKITMSMLLLKDAFDAFLLEEAEVLTYAKLVLKWQKENKNMVYWCKWRVKNQKIMIL